MHDKIAKLRELKLLFVEDEEDLTSIISDTLKKLGANFLIAKNGKEGLEIFQNNPDIDVVITDINMPIMNGLDMITEIKKISNVEVVIMSAHTESEYIDRSKALGVEHYLLKPFDFLKFIDLVVSLEKK
ncbi:response regulator [Arcobacter sp. FWKO B]|uniref:response regulator n=1 Tax=Arcobacter sp. FWKO B TaxID=2593672 RepID=UPI0019047EA2|nr:response regulator [Arcobacter sp. FWKO B]